MSVQDLCPAFNYIIFSYWIVGDLYYVFWVLPLIGRDFYFLHWLFLLLRESSLVWDWGASWAWQPGFRCSQLCPWGFSGRWGVEPREALEVFRLVNRIRYVYSGEQEVKPWIKQSGRWAPDTWGQHPSLYSEDSSMSRHTPLYRTCTCTVGKFDTVTLVFLCFCYHGQQVPTKQWKETGPLLSSSLKISELKCRLNSFRVSFFIWC